MTWSEAFRPPLRPPMPSATTARTQPVARGWLSRATWSCWYSRSPLWMPVDAVSRYPLAMLQSLAAPTNMMRTLDYCPRNTYYRANPTAAGAAPADDVNSNLHSPERRLIELRMEHADLDALIDRAADEETVDELMMRRLKKRRLALRDQIARLELVLDPKEPA